jgi:hypothetical protein
MKVLGACALLLCAVFAGGARAATTPFYAIDDDPIAVPGGVQPWLPTYTPDGRTVVFQNQLDGTTWTVPASGAGAGAAKCITCGFPDRPVIDGGFTYAFPDGRRLFLAHELGGDGGVDAPANADAYILECTPSILDCASHQYLPVDMSADKGSKYIVQRRTWHLAPDGVHLGWSEIRLDGSIMVVARLERQADRYVAADQKVVNPHGLSGSSDRSVDHWENASQLYELKSFVDGGRSILALTEKGANVDVVKVNLKSGAVRRMTSNPDWDEDGALSRDGDLEVLYSWRTRHRIDALGWIPQLRGFNAMGVAAAVAPYYVSTWQGFQCDLSPWLLPGTGDAGGSLTGQPLNVYGNGLTPGNNLSGQQFWSPDSTSVLLQERTTTRPSAGVNEHVAQKGLTPSRVMVAHIRRAPTKPAPVASSAVGSWAPSPTTYAETLDSNTTVTLKGSHGGTVKLVYKGSLAEGTWAMTYNKYTEDGHTFLTGAQSAGRTMSGIWTIKGTIRVTGRHTGSLAEDLTIGPGGAGGLPTMTGSVKATYDGKRAPARPRLGACPSQLPKRSPIAVKAHHSGSTVSVSVSATISGDHRPIAGATIHLGSAKATTNTHGLATLHGSAKSVTIDAGSTFLPGKATIH